MKQFHDQTGKLVFIPSTPRRIVSLVPSLTELLYSFDLEEEVVGITKFCVHPDKWFKTKQRIGGTKNADVVRIKNLQPDLVIASKEENIKEQVESIAEFCPVYCTDIITVEDAYNAIAQIGNITNRTLKAEKLVTQLKQNFSSLQPPPNKLKCVYLIWNNPYMTVGADTFIHEMLAAAGFENVYRHQLRYPVTNLEQISSLETDVVLFSSEPFPFKQLHLASFAAEWKRSFPTKKIPLLQIVDGEMFSWYGSRLLHATEYFKKLRESLFLSDELTV